ncbi:unnamed protein product, partial [Scytosiphon promiscuus]
ASSWREAGHTLWLPLIRQAKWHSEGSVRDYRRRTWSLVMRVRRALYGLATVAACLLPTASGDAPSHVEGGEEGLRGVEREMEVEAAINQQLMLAERCSSSEHARACQEDSVMLFAETMFGGCSPVGCF